MFAHNVILFAAVGLAAAMPNPTPVEDIVPDRVLDAPLAKRTTHWGKGTIYLQEGGYGSCGNKNPDSSKIIALSNYWQKSQSPGPYCGRKIKVTNTGNGKTIEATVQDTCPSCDENHLDLSLGAWNELTNSAAWGVIDISWNFCNVNGQC